MRMWVWSLASLNGLRIRRCCELWCTSHTQGLDLALLWLWHRPTAVALIWLRAWEPPYATGVVPPPPKKRRRRKSILQEEVLVEMRASANALRLQNSRNSQEARLGGAWGLVMLARQQDLWPSSGFGFCSKWDEELSEFWAERWDTEGILLETTTAVCCYKGEMREFPS